MAANNDVTKKLHDLAQYVQEGLTSGHLETIMNAAKDVQDCQKLLTVINAVVQQVGQKAVEQVQTEMAKNDTMTTKESPSTNAPIEASTLRAETTAQELPKKRLSMFSPEEVEQSVVYSSDDDANNRGEDDNKKERLQAWTTDNVYCFVTTVKIHLSLGGDDGHANDTIRVVKTDDGLERLPRMYILGRLQKPNNARACTYRVVLAMMPKRAVTGFGQKEHVNALQRAREDLKVDRKSGTKSPYFDVTRMQQVQNGPLGDGLEQYTADVYNDATKENANALRMLTRDVCCELMQQVEKEERRAKETLLAQLRPSTTPSIGRRTADWAEEDDEDADNED